MSGLDPEAKERLIEAFRASLDDWDAAGKDEGEAPVDLFSLLAEMASLNNEVRLQSRQFKSTLDELRRFGDDLRARNERLERELDRAREQYASIQAQTERPLLLGLLDLRDRLQAGVEAAARPPASLLARLLPGLSRFAASLAQGQRLSLQRLDDLLASYRMRPIPALGEPLAPERMRVVGVEAADDVADGTVLREARRGFFKDGEIFRVAEVIVCKKANKA
ncbi:MAG: nucleotide exchange factor GrpE [Sterolibacteriaceae bacterium]|uniref:Nucleotide exchange factor GrpE n=1 Tax=Candidatus Methylophosphatis roskildensis TaxID=2899263 RepID=A0A9D7E3I8_9PROT|nr:nucleotide exchange factor GrpE [Candidatus Methylophosphatis roskildensis]MBK7237503.1 nucleotide exchange factor GrpE [Sterolibacteriaceae bacterium]